MPQANGIHASLVCDGTPLTEYPNPSLGPNTVFCQSTPGQNFKVEFSGPEAPSDCIAHLYCDGVYMDGYAFPRDRQIKSTFHGIYLPNDDTKLLPFEFANVELCEEDDSHPEQIVKNLGTVSIEVFHCILGPSKPANTSIIPSVASNNKFSERNKKASMIPHTIGLGGSIPASTKRTSTARSTHMLITAGVIPRPASPLPNIRISTPPPVTHQDDDLHVEACKDIKPDIKPKSSGSKPVVIDLCDDSATSAFFSSSIDHPILLDDDEDEPVIQSSESLPQASSSLAQQADIKPAKIELDTALDGQPNQRKRVQAETKVEETDQKRVKLEMISVALNDSDATLEDENSV